MLYINIIYFLFNTIIILLMFYFDNIKIYSDIKLYSDINMR